MKTASNIKLFLYHNRRFLKSIRNSKTGQIVFLLYPRIRRLYNTYYHLKDLEKKNRACADVLDAIENTLFYRARKWIRCFLEDFSLFFRQFGRRETIDYSKKNKQDYYSIAVIVKNEARYMREFIP